MLGFNFRGEERQARSKSRLCEVWLQNPYYQYFCGEEFFQRQLPFDRSPLMRWRQRISLPPRRIAGDCLRS